MFTTRCMPGAIEIFERSIFQQSLLGYIGPTQTLIPISARDNFSQFFSTFRSKELKWRRGGSKDKKDLEDLKDECPSIISANPFTERKSVFQGHAASVTNVCQIKLILAKLYEKRKIAQATHNIYAYRIDNEETKKWFEDYDDDGEIHAGGRLIHLLQILDAKNVIVVVSRWFGGVLLGGDRFKLIGKAAREALELGNYIVITSSALSGDDESKKKNKKK